MTQLHHRLALSLALAGATAAASAANPILFVAQVPIPDDFATIASVFGNHRADTEYVGRGGDLYIRYPDGTLRNLTAEAGFGTASGFQGANSIAVRDPAVHWSGSKAIFSMVIGAPTIRFQRVETRWQLYEVAGLGAGQPVSITKVANQPGDYNNVEPAYASDGTIIFSSDRPRNGAAHLYPQVDEYESRDIVTGLWRLDPASGDLRLLQHSPSGSFTPIVDSFGRILYTRWDHLQRDQQNDVPTADTFNYTSEAADSVPTTSRAEVFPAPRIAPPGSVLLDHRFNQMFPWQLNQDGTSEETVNHLGRHELLSYFDRSRNDDANLVEFNPGTRFNPNPVSFVLQMKEDPTKPGRYLAIDAREFQVHASGQLIRFEAPPTLDADKVTFEYLTSRATYCCNDANDPEHTGHYRTPLPMSDGTIVVSHTDYKGVAQNIGTAASPRSPFQFRLKRVAPNGPYVAPVEALTGGITRNVSWFDPDNLISFDGELWELSPVEVVAKPVPPATGFSIAPPEQAAFDLEGVDAASFRSDLAARGLGVLVMRDVTTRESRDKQQPYNLRVPGGVQTIAGPGKVYDITHMQFFQGDQIRGGGGSSNGRRVLAQLLHEPAAVALNAPSGGPPASATIFPDGSAAFYVPTRRALAWQSIGPEPEPVVQERVWITVQPGEIRACDGCHGVNSTNQAGAPEAENTALAFRAMLRRWKDEVQGGVFANGFE